jgi:hypothetical protein
MAAANIKKYEMLASEGNLARLFSNVNVLDSNACWNWTGTKVKDGYGIMTRKIENKVLSIFVHRLAWVTQNGEIPDGMVIDHTCHTKNIDNCKGACQHRSCINPNHLRVATIQENLRIKRANHNAKFPLSAYQHRREKKGTCKKGHLWIEENMVIRKSGKVDCLPCRKIQNNKSNAKVGA